LLIRAPDYASQGAEIVYNSAYFEGKAVRGKAVGQKIMESPWYAAGTFNNVVIPMVYIEGSGTITGGVTANSYVDKLKVIVYKRYPGQDSFTTKELFVNYVNNMSNTIGIAPHAEQFYRPSWQPTWFDIRYEYKFAIEVEYLTTGAFLDVEGIYLQYYVANSVMAGRQVQFGANTTQGIPVMGGMYWSATTDGAGNITCAIPSEFFPYSAGFTKSENATGSTPGSTDLANKNVFNSVDAVITTLAGGTDINNEWLIWSYEVVDGDNGGYTAYVGLHSDNAATVYYFYTFMYGYMNALVV
jgi:hypothetical protein